MSKEITPTFIESVMAAMTEYNPHSESAFVETIMGICSDYDPKKDSQLIKIKDLEKQVMIAGNKLKGIPKLKEKIVTLQESNEKMSESLDFYLIQQGSALMNE
jgi:hypothetical protein